MSAAEGRKKGKDTKALSKKKRNASSEDEARGSSTVGTVQQKSTKKQKVNQEKEGRKGQKVCIILTIIYSAPF